ncbi:MAG: pyridoxal-dependent decarboxylase, partial [Bacteroidota bacterium]
MKYDSLDHQAPEFKALLEKGNELVIRQFANLDEEKAYRAPAQSEVVSWFDEALPEAGMDEESLFQLVQDKIMDTATGNLGPHMYAYVMAGGTQMSIVAEQLAATINQNVGKWHLAPAISELEKRVVQWGADMMQLGKDVGGVLVSGGSAANLAGLTVARNLFLEKSEVRKQGLFGQKPLVVYASREVHGCVDKSLEVLGIGTDNLRKIDTNAAFEIDTQALIEQIESDLQNDLQPFCVVGTAGTVNTGAIDDLKSLRQIADRYQMWFHVDGAYGGLAAALPGLRPAYNGIELADSVAIDFHKWLYQPFEVGCLLVN